MKRLLQFGWPFALCLCVGSVIAHRATAAEKSGHSAVTAWPMVDSEVQFIPNDREYFSCQAWSPDGRGIACVENGFLAQTGNPTGLKGRNRIWIVDSDAGLDGTERLLAEMPLPGFVQVMWPPPGNSLYVIRQRVVTAGTKLQGSLYRIRVSDGKVQEVMKWPSSKVPWGNCFSPDGRRLALDWGGVLEIVDLSSMKRKVIYRWRPQGGNGLSWSPDGQTIAFGRNHTISVISPSGRGLRVVSRSGSHPSWSPDGRWIVFGRETNSGISPGGAPISPRFHAWVVRPDGTGEHPLAPEIEGEQMNPVWSPRGDRVFYSRTEYRRGKCPARWFVGSLRVADPQPDQY